ncbi:MAG: hypothetical protein LBD91_00515 [Prevotellaceae bacterium]|nr:hypothetical protein [Prevotellaceae bacterium]
METSIEEGFALYLKAFIDTGSFCYYDVVFNPYYHNPDEIALLERSRDGYRQYIALLGACLWLLRLDVAPEQTGEYTFRITVTSTNGTAIESVSPPVNILRSAE